MEKQEVIDLMKSSKSEQEWNANCDKVKKAERAKTGADYPEWWFYEIILSGLLNQVRETW